MHQVSLSETPARAWPGTKTAVSVRVPSSHKHWQMVSSGRRTDWPSIWPQPPARSMATSPPQEWNNSEMTSDWDLKDFEGSQFQGKWDALAGQRVTGVIRSKLLAKECRKEANRASRLWNDETYSTCFTVCQSHFLLKINVKWLKVTNKTVGDRDQRTWERSE